jgi:hypothetical protein
LFDELARKLSNAKHSDEQIEAEKKFKKHVAEYRDRMAKHAAKLFAEVFVSTYTGWHLRCYSPWI